MTTSVCQGATIDLKHLVIGVTMSWAIALTGAALTGWTVEWAQRMCEQWVQERDKGL